MYTLYVYYIYIYTYTRTHTFYVVRDRYPQSTAPSPRNSSTENAHSDTEVTADSGSSSESEGHALHPSEPATWRVGGRVDGWNHPEIVEFHALPCAPCSIHLRNVLCGLAKCQMANGCLIIDFEFFSPVDWWSLLIQHSPLKITWS